MRWDSLFDDLESQLEHELHSDETDLRAEEYRHRLGRLALRERISTFSRGGGRERQPVTVELVTGETLALLPQTFGRDWFSADAQTAGADSGAVLVSMNAIAAILVPKSVLARSLDVPEVPDSDPRLTDRIGIAFALRDLCRRRAFVQVHCANAVSAVHSGTIDRVGRDHFDLAVHEPGQPRRERNVAHQRLIPFSQLAYLRL
ncbi:hypothetical protein [Mycetocola zhadangensis]|uniref:Uncharacterized protein n=1 Tax=Mycetocola zhadangensis TaxID=1164595 RepID=A0A3L7ITF1_9MICO|nr:hypothetical protein [Mycetocola zhadangensis]RLQ81497.1 hypothetical protein D9V28_14205 [Mycetocola zhadangensis]GGF01210.1 hypothetical protein GCM10011313_25340 [Mycetocola zhadangensis]